MRNATSVMCGLCQSNHSKAHTSPPSHHNSSNRASSQDALKAAQSSIRSSVQAQQDSSHNNTDATGSDANSILCTPRWHPKESKTPNHNQNYSPKLSNSNKESHERVTNCTCIRQQRHSSSTNQTRREATADARLAERSHIRPDHNPHMVRRTVQRLRTRHRNRRVP
jgi:hypothetical protein